LRLRQRLIWVFAVLGGAVLVDERQTSDVRVSNLALPVRDLLSSCAHFLPNELRNQRMRGHDSLTP
jgi:hypothetical protein